MLQDTYGRTVDYLRISITDRCDLRCTYCIPKGFTEFEKPSHWLNFDEIERIVRQFALLGTRRFRLTGGEPLLRKNIVQLVQRLKSIYGVEDLSLSTNATQLENYADDLRQAGLDRLNISLDSLSQDNLYKIVGTDVQAKIMKGLKAAKNAGFEKTKINMVVLTGINEHEIEKMVAFCIQNEFILRLIELMPMGATAQNHQYFNLQPVIERLSKTFQLQPTEKKYGGGPARYWQNQEGTFLMGYITPLSQHFCQSCNRVRMSVDGTLYMCLGHEHQYSLAPLLKNNVNDLELQRAIQHAVQLKPFQHEFIEKPKKLIRVMSMTGG
ncbi:GTP 3',8-cyclase MoaA [Acinetobacter sp. ANC 4558]|uniref:GTP 3',8-cyclase MoaA n=1 Tax=Acinetobacter sp. ANC 4558 TaxID=1977876 RepID=UPI000A33FE7B|nr:GTP 3',8-cyclase MoaA [Acinetobacter sp. ANC 4558]OTG87062.1 GTP 3',8-cyclase MoaA [Acinetobacter sp. ANC 4558]